MDPNLFYLNYERLFEVLVTIVIFSFFIERALSVVFESRGFIKMYGDEDEKKGLKEIIALALSISACVYWQFDALSIAIELDCLSPPRPITLDLLNTLVDNLCATVSEI